MAIVKLYQTKGGEQLDISDDCTQLDSITLNAGFPFSEFSIPELKYTVLKRKIVNANYPREVFSIIGKDPFTKTDFTTILNISSKKSSLIKANNTLRIDALDKTLIDSRSLTMFLNTFSIVYDSSFELSSAYFDASVGIFALSPSGSRFIPIYENGLNTDDLIVNYFEDETALNYETLKEVLNTIRWVGVNMSPNLASIDANNNIIISNKIKLINPFTFHSGNPTVLNEDLITDWKEESSKIGYDLSFDLPKDQVESHDIQYTENVGYGKSKQDPIGDGFIFKFNSTSDFKDDVINHKSFKVDVSADFRRAVYKFGLVYMNNFLNIISSTLIIMTTLEDIPIIPYTKVQIREKTYYCIQAKLPYVSHGEYKYKLQEIK